ERDLVDACAQSTDQCFGGLDIGEIVRLFALQTLQFDPRLAQLEAAAARQGDAPGLGRAQGADDIDAGRVALVADPGAHGLEGVGAGDVAFDQVGQFQVLEHEIEEFLLGDLKDEVIQPLALVAGTTAGTACAATGRAGDAFSGDELLVAGVHGGLAPTLTMVENRFVDVAAWNADLLAVFHVGYGASANRFLHRFFDMAAVAAQKALAVHRALVLAIQSAVDHI